jgi:hypothetical protein
MERNSKKNSQKVLGFKFLEFGVCVAGNVKIASKSLKICQFWPIMTNFDQF